MEELRKLDQVAHVRFASVYREFKDLSSFMSELETLMKNGKTEGTDSKNDTKLIRIETCFNDSRKKLYWQRKKLFPVIRQMD
mgnify:CR=1 FL=1